MSRVGAITWRVQRRARHACVADASHVSVRARGQRRVGQLVAARRRRAARRRSCRRAAPAGASTPVTPSTTLLRWPLMSVTTAGVPHAAASVSVSPHPSASEALATSHARRYSVDEVVVRRRGRAKRDPARPRRARRPSASSSARIGPSPTMMQLAGRARVARATTAASISSSNRFTGANRPTATTSGVGERSPPGLELGARRRWARRATRSRPEAELEQLVTGRVATASASCVRR